MSDFIRFDQNNNPIFIGRDDPANPPVNQSKECSHGTDTCSHMQCPVCGGYFDYLVGDDENGGRRGCEKCYIPPSTPIKHDVSSNDEGLI